MLLIILATSDCSKVLLVRSLILPEYVITTHTAIVDTLSMRLPTLIAVEERGSIREKLCVLD